MPEEPNIYDLETEYFQLCQKRGTWQRRFEIVKTMEKMKKVPGTEMAAYDLCHSHLTEEARINLNWHKEV